MGPLQDPLAWMRMVSNGTAVACVLAVPRLLPGLARCQGWLCASSYSSTCSHVRQDTSLGLRNHMCGVLHSMHLSVLTGDGMLMQTQAASGTAGRVAVCLSCRVMSGRCCPLTSHQMATMWQQVSAVPGSSSLCVALLCFNLCTLPKKPSLHVSNSMYALCAVAGCVHGR